LTEKRSSICIFIYQNEISNYFIPLFMAGCFYSSQS
jgi:hypothetical protein